MKTAKLSASLNNGTTEKNYTFHQMFGMLRAFDVIGRSNVKLPATVDFWLHKNKKELASRYNKAVDEREKLMREYCKTYTHTAVVNHKPLPPVTFSVLVGKDETDTILKDEAGFYKMEGEKIVPIPFDQRTGACFWDKVIPAVEAVEGGVNSEPVAAVPERIEKVAYDAAWNTETSKMEFLEKLSEIQNGENFAVELYPIKAENLHGLNVIKVDENKEPIEEYINLIYDNAVIS